VTGSRFKVVVTDQVFPSIDIERELLASIGAELVVADGSRDGVLREGRDAQAFLNTYLPIDADLLRSCQDLRIVARYGIGVDNVDLAAARDVGVIVTNVPDYSVEEVAAHALALILSLVRRVAAADDLVRSGGWGIDSLRPIRRVSTLTFGLLGYGRIARRLATSIEALGGRIIVHDPYIAASEDGPELVSIDELAYGADVISVHTPLTDSTRGLFDHAMFERMRPGTIFVNTSRGPLVVLDDLLAALRAGRLGGAGLDVFPEEPLDPSLVEGVPNLLLSPHMAYYSEQSLQESQRKAATQVVKALSGEAVDYRVNV
jgi:D-3-phosphoglycerate dehydrogenase